MNEDNYEDKKLLIYYPIKKLSERGWILEGGGIIGKGNASEVYKVCKDFSCDYVMKIIHKYQHDQIKREICFQKLLANKGLAIPIVDWWLYKDKGGVIIMPIMKETLGQRLKRIDSNIKNIHERNDAKWELIKRALRMILELHSLGISHNDSKVENIMFDNSDKMYFIDMGVADFLWKPTRKGPIGQIVRDYNQLFFYDNKTIKFMFGGFLECLRNKLKSLEEFETVSQEEQKIVNRLIGLKYYELRKVLKPYNKICQKK